MDYNLTTNEPVIIEYPGPDSDLYPNNSYKLWTVEAPPDHDIDVNFTSFELNHTNSRLDNVFIGSPNETFLNHGGGAWMHWTGFKPASDIFGLFHRTFEGPLIYIIFTSDYKGQAKGFSVELQAVPTVETGKV